MSKKTEFIKYLESVINEEDMNTEALTFWKELTSKSTSGGGFTDTGVAILKYMQTLAANHEPMRSKDIAEATLMTARTISGGIRKLVSDGYIDKVGTDPVTYQINELGREIIID